MVPKAEQSGFTRLLAVRDVADVLGKSELFVRQLIHGGVLPAVRVGVNLRIKPGDIVSYLEKNPSRGPDPRRDGRINGRRPGRPRLTSEGCCV